MGGDVTETEAIRRLELITGLGLAGAGQSVSGLRMGVEDRWFRIRHCDMDLKMDLRTVCRYWDYAVEWLEKRLTGA